MERFEVLFPPAALREKLTLTAGSQGLEFESPQLGSIRLTPEGKAMRLVITTKDEGQGEALLNPAG